MKFHNRLSLTLLGVWALCLGALYHVVSWSLERHQRQDALGTLATIAMATERDLASFLDERCGDLRVLAASDTIRGQVDRQGVTERLTAVRDAYGCYAWLRLLDVRGVVVADTNQLHVGEPSPEALPSSPIYTVVYEPSGDGQGMVAVLQYPIESGWLQAAVPLQRLDHQIGDRQRWPGQSSVQILGKDGVLLYSTEGMDGVGRPYPLAQAKILSALGDLPALDGVRVRSPGTSTGNWVVIATLPSHIYLEAVEHVQQVILIAALSGLVVGAWLINRTTRKLSRPLSELAVQAASLGQGATLSPSPGHGIVEIDELRRVLNDLSVRLGDRIHALQAAQERMRFAAKAARVGIWEFDSSNGRLHWDEGMFDLYGVAPSGFTGSYTDWASRVLPEDLPAIASALQAACAPGGGPFVGSFRIRRDGDQAVRWIDTMAEIIRAPDGTARKVIGVNWDITERMQAQQALLANEERWQFALAGSDNGVWDWDVPCGKAYVDLRWRDMLGYGDLAAEQDLPFLMSLIHPEDRPALDKRIQEHLQGTTPRLISEHRFRCADGSWKWILARGVAVRRDAVGNAERIVGTHNDITQRRATEEQLRAATVAAEAAGRAKADFLATMSHEIRTPMNGVIGMTELLLDGSLDTMQRDMVCTIRDSGRSLMQILNDILDYSKIEAGRLELECLPFDPRTLAREVTALLMPMAELKGLLLRLDLDADAPAVLLGDAGRCRQVLLNLLGNAVKFTTSGSVVVRVAGQDGQCRLTVTDTGIGIAPEARDRLFQRFSQIDASTTRRFGGTGLGLAISMRLVENMGGTISVDSEVGRGSVFCFSLPLPATGSMPQSSSSSPTPIEIGPMRMLDILVAEDNPVNQRVAKAMLERQGHRVTMVVNGIEAVAAVSQKNWDVILMDMQMPEMDGLTATREIRSRSTSRRLPIIALTANAMRDEREACLAAGMDDVLAKPVTGQALATCLSRWVV